MRKNWGFAVFGLVFLLLLIGNAKAQSEYQSTNQLFVGSGFQSPVVACNDDSSACLALIYTESDKLVRWYYSTDKFVGDKRWVLSVSKDFSSYVLLYQIGGYFWGHLPIDVSYDSSLNVFWVAIDDDVWDWNAGYWFVPNLHVVGDNTLNCLDSASDPTNLLKIDDGYIYGVCGAGACTNKTLTRWEIPNNVSFFFPPALSRDSSFTIPLGSVSLTPCQSYGFIADGLPSRYRIRAKSGGSYAVFSNISTSAVPLDHDISHYDGNYLYWGSPIGNNISRIFSTDLSSFGAISVYYAFNASKVELVTITDISNTNSKQYIFKELNSLSGGSGAYTYNTIVFPYNFVSKYADPTTETISFANTTASVNCSGSLLIQSGDIFTINSPCITTANIILDSGDYIPTHSVNNVNTGSCSNLLITPIYRPKNYIIPIKVIDSISLTPISGATVTVGTQSNTTDSNGIAIVNIISPVSNAGFVTIQSGCQVAMSVNGTANNFHMTITAPNYNTYDVYNETFVTPTPTGLNYDDLKIKSVDVEGVRLTVKIYSKDGYELNTTGVGSLYVFGANQTYWYYNGIQLVNNAYSFPAYFALIDNRTEYPINMSLTYGNKTYTTFFVSGVNYTEFNVTTNNNYNIAFFIDDLLSDAPCLTADSCTGSHCQGLTYYTLSGCLNDKCEYETSTCNYYCDDRVGCYDIQTSEDCTTDFDCTSNCVTGSQSLTGFCGSDSLCKQKRIICTIVNAITGVGCNNSTGRCAETDLCYSYGGTRRFRFLVQAQIVPAGAFQEANYTTFLDKSFWCGIDNFKQRTCISGVTINQDSSIVGITTIPDIWKTSANGSLVTFQDISLYCDLGCNVTYNYCQYGCNDVSGICNQKPFSTEGQANSIIQGIVTFLNTMFPDIASKTAVSIIFIMIAVSLVTFLLNKVNNSSNWQVGLGLAILLALGLAFEGWIDVLLTILFSVIAGFIIVRYTFWTNTG